MRSVIIAEAGTSHLGSLTIAENLVQTAHVCGADAIKFQVFDAPSRDSMFCWMNGDEDRAYRWHQSAMPYPSWGIVKDLCDDLGISLMFSCFEKRTVYWQNNLRLKVAKVASRAVQSYPYHISNANYFLISTGMAKTFTVPKYVRYALMECESKYPSERPWTGKFPCYSCHSGYPFRALQAIIDGCPIIEVHFAIHPSQAGPDEPVSLTPLELMQLCHARDYYERYGD